MAYITVFASYNSVGSGRYVNDWTGMLDILEKPKLLDTTADDFAKLKKVDGKKALALKFANGGYDCGPCPVVKDLVTGEEKPSRKAGVARPSEYNVITLDCDNNLPDDFDEKVHSILKEYEYFSHATISSRTDKIRRRIVIPLDESISADVREACVRYLAEKLGMEHVDKASARNKQLMVFPVFCKDGDQYMFHNETGKFFKPMDFLPSGWESVTNWPMWKDEEKPKTCGRKNRPRKVYEETGQWIPIHDNNRLHYAFNKTYRISDILKEDGGYTMTGNGRWSHNYDDVKDGIKVTNDAILYSYYGTDRLSVESDLDSFETALVLRYGNISDKTNWKLMIMDVSKDEKVLATLKKMLPVDLPDEAENWKLLYDSTEEGIANRCKVFFPDKTRFGKWWHYDGGIYKQVTEKAMLPSVLLMLRICAALEPENTTIAEMVGSNNKARAILNIWQGLCEQDEVPDEEWENKPYYLHFTDCVIDLEKWCKGEPDYVLEHSPEMLLTESTGHAWSDIEHVDKVAMNEVVTNMETYLPDEQIRNYFQMAIGRALVGGVSANEDKCVWMLSPDGGSGKSTILNAIAGAMGSYFYSMKAKVLYYNSKENDSDKPVPEIMGAKNKRFVQFCEYNGVRTLDPERYKNYTAAGMVKGRSLFSNDNSYRAKCCCFVDTNSMPGLMKREYSILRRSRVIPFLAKLRGNEMIKNKWEMDKNIHCAMLVYLMLGLKMWWENGCRLDMDINDKSIPSVCYTETMSWIQSFDDPSDFFEDYYEVTNDEKNDFLVADKCYETYRSQVYDRGASLHAFRQAEERWLREHGITKKAKRIVNDYGLRRMCYVGVRMIGTYEAAHDTYGKFNHIQEVKAN